MDAFLAQYWDDQSRGEVRPLGEYLQLFPDDEDGIAAQYLALKREGAEAPPQETDRLGPYRIEGEIGRGGQGIVYRAVDTRLGRPVALKILHGLGPASQHVLLRFKREADVAAKLNHPSLCTVYDAGQIGSVAYIAMELIEGESLREKIRTAVEGDISDITSYIVLEDSARGDRDSGGAANQTVRSGPPVLGHRWSWREIAPVLTVIEEVARALHAVHEARVVHRDIKPANIIIRPDRRPVIMDFGLAREEDSDQPSLTQTGDLFGTPEYMSPEQLTHKAIRLDRRTDVWSLGVTLYECLTLHRPFQGETRQVLFKRIILKDPPDPRKLNPALSDDLCAVLETALEKDLDRRYQTALALAEDLRRVRMREPIHARPITRWIKLKRWVQRNPALAVTTGTAALILVVGAVVSTLFALRADQKAAEAEANLTEWERLADGRRLEDLLAEADGPLWPAVPRNIDAMEAWLVNAEALARRLPAHRAALLTLQTRAEPYSEHLREQDRALRPEEEARLSEIGIEMAQLATVVTEEEGEVAAAQHTLRSLEEADDPTSYRDTQRVEREITRADQALKAARGRRSALESEMTRLQGRASARRTWRFSDSGDQFRHDKLQGLVGGLEGLLGEPSATAVTLAGVRDRLHLARTLRSRLSGEDQRAWHVCQQDVARLDGPYRGLDLPPQAGLVPLGRNRDTHLWEFWHVPSGARPEWQGVPLGLGRVVLHASSGEEGIALVLIPAGTFMMGARPPNAGDPEGAANVDPGAYADEFPVHGIVLDAFFISKYELTQGQWQRQRNENPSLFAADQIHDDERMTWRHPVTNVDWDQCVEACRRWDLLLPTEAQWEGACRAGTSTVFSSGNSLRSLSGHANIGDAARSRRYGASFQGDFDDGHVNASAVGTYLANGFGLNDMHGNVWEWCRDGHFAYDTPVRAGDGLRGPLHGQRYRVIRGGSFHDIALYARSADRYRNGPGVRNCYLGLRASKAITRPRRASR